METNRSVPSKVLLVFLLSVLIVLGSTPISSSASETPETRSLERLDEYTDREALSLREEIYNEDGSGYYAHELLVVFTPGISDEAVSEIISSVDGKIIIALADNKSGFFTVIRIADSLSIEEAKVVLDECSEVLIVGSSNFYPAFPEPSGYAVDDNQKGIESTDPYSSSASDYPWHITNIAALDAWDLVKADNSVTVVTFDTGVITGHPGLSGVIDTENAYDAYTMMPGCEDAHGHGTEVAGAISANGNLEFEGAIARGVSYGAQVLPIRVSPAESSNAYLPAVIRAFEYIDDLSSSKIKVINMSFGTDLSSVEESDRQTIQILINNAREEGILCIAAAGNFMGEIATFPACLDNVVSVGALEKGGTRADFSNYGTDLDIMAPGVDIVTTAGGILGIPFFRSDSWGTSIAAPIVSGTAALIYAANPSITPDRVEAILYASATDLGDPGRDNDYGHGKVNAFKAVSRYTASKSLSVDRLGGATRYDTMSLIAQYGRTSSNYAVVVSGNDGAWPDALSAAGLAGVRNAPILTTNPNLLSFQTMNALAALNVRYVYIVGGTGVVSPAVQTAIGNIANVTTVTRLSGADRYATAEAVYKAASSTSWLHPTGGHKDRYYSSDHTWKNGSRKKVAILATGTNWPDAMVASSLSAYTRSPIFLVQANGTLTEETKRLLSTGKFDELICVGGGISSAAGVGCGLVDPADIVGAPIHGNPDETFKPGQNWYYIVSGETRYETAEKAYIYCILEGVPSNKVLIASGTTPVDALPSGALKYPILLANDGKTNTAHNVIRSRAYNISTIVLLGGTGTVNDSTTNEMIKGWRRGQSGNIIDSLMDIPIEDSADYPKINEPDDRSVNN